jgi:hypothetical protein
VMNWNGMERCETGRLTKGKVFSSETMDWSRWGRARSRRREGGNRVYRFLADFSPVGIRDSTDLLCLAMWSFCWDT